MVSAATTRRLFRREGGIPAAITNCANRYKQYDSNYPDDLREKVDINVDIDLRAERPFSDTISVSSVVEIIKRQC